MTLGSTQPLTEMSTVPGVFPGGKGGRCIGLTTYHHPVPLSCNLGTLTSWNPVGHSRPVTGLLYLLPNNGSRRQMGCNLAFKGLVSGFRHDLVEIRALLCCYAA